MKALTQIIANLSDLGSRQPQSSQVRFECPNCWGTQQWDGVEYPAVDIIQKDTTTIGRARDGFIQRFAKQFLSRPRRRY